MTGAADASGESDARRSVTISPTASTGDACSAVTSEKRSTRRRAGNSTAHSPAMTRVATPPSVDGSGHAQELAGDARLGRAQLVRRPDEHVLDGEHPTAADVGRHQWHQRGADEHAHGVGRGQDHQRDEGDREAAGEPEDNGERRRRGRPRSAGSIRRGAAADAGPGSRPSGQHRCPRRRGASPRPTAPTPRRSSAMAGRSATAPPNSTANRSSEMAPSRIGVRRMKRRPSNASWSDGRSGALAVGVSGPGPCPAGTARTRRRRSPARRGPSRPGTARPASRRRGSRRRRARRSAPPATRPS